MTTIINRIIELAGWIVLGVSVILLAVASHIDNYQPPESVNTLNQAKPHTLTKNSDI
ncbi:division septum protein Blr [Leclercia adecarboxylata]|uniref:division septum protein Blr n=1 Tax=Leclercia TaxID=83654 RepID=UPI001BDC57A3|nr:MULTISPECIES: division septum protein Blr [Leclercia]MCZ7839148.1 division septum protein Blr [Leclercia adecarboxylata]QVV62245.1 division septum protein Blr [Leclercia sp. Colony189]